MGKPTDKEIEELKAKYGECHLLEEAAADDIAEADLARVVVKVPSKAEWSVFRGMVNDAAQQAKAVPTVLRQCIVWPSLDDWDAMTTKRPGLVETFGSELVEIAGLRKGAVRKKL